MGDGVEQRLSPAFWPRHRHRTAYAALVLSGGYLEAGANGRYRVEAGDVLIHPAFDAHQNDLSRDSWVLNLPIGPSQGGLPTAFRARDPETVLRLARRDPRRAAAALQAEDTRAPLQEDWPDALAQDLKVDPTLRLGPWGRARGLSAAAVTRGFQSLFGLSPARFRTEQAVLQALALFGTGETLAQIAQISGFSDQAHMTRAVRALTGVTPLGHRRKSVQDALGVDF